MTRWLLRLYPKPFRDRYGDELAEFIADSNHLARDVINIAAHAIRLRLETLMRIRPLRHLANAFVVATAFVLGYVVNDLEGGVTELGRHWWSSIALVLIALSIAARAAIEIVDARRQPPPTH
jgi:hypothetical protein